MTANSRIHGGIMDFRTKRSNLPITGMGHNVLSTWVPTNSLDIMFVIFDYICKMACKTIK